MPKTLAQMKSRLAEALTEATEAEEIIPLLKQAIAKFSLIPSDLFEHTTAGSNTSQQRALPKKRSAAPKDTKSLKSPKVSKTAKYRDANGNTWVGLGRRPAWLTDALARGSKLEDFRQRVSRLRRAK